MKELQLVKSNNSLAPAYQTDADELAKVKSGQLVHVKIKRPRNPQFHRKYFALINLGFEYWNPEPLDTERFKLKSVEWQKDPEVFRENVQIMAGYGYPVVDVRDRVHWRSKSISFSNMEQGQFDQLYKNVFSVIWDLVLKSNFESEADAERAAEELMRFG